MAPENPIHFEQLLQSVDRIQAIALKSPFGLLIKDLREAVASLLDRLQQKDHQLGQLRNQLDGTVAKLQSKGEELVQLSVRTQPLLQRVTFLEDKLRSHDAAIQLSLSNA